VLSCSFASYELAGIFMNGDVQFGVDELVVWLVRSSLLDVN
jgi:hypothetical protein